MSWQSWDKARSKLLKQEAAQERLLRDMESVEIRSRADMLAFCREAPPDTRYVYLVKIFLFDCVVEGRRGCWLSHDLKITHNSLLPGMIMRAMVLLTEWAVKRPSLHLSRPDAFVVQKSVSSAVQQILSDHRRALLGPEFPLEPEFRKLKDALDRDGVRFKVYRRLEDASDKPRQITLPTISA